MTKWILLIVMSIFFFVLGSGIFFHFYLQPFFTSESEIVSADPFTFMAFIFGGSAGLLMLAPLNTCFRLIYKREINIKMLCAIPLLAGCLSAFLNFQIYQKIITPQGLIECPKKSGYKKNLLRDYVKNIQQCEKF
ncbi:hypothetical protein [Vibrio gazogenes]|uniref:DUF1240 domain-containing protein n=1 Tax=Vibrio gazogenes TaxID=687 RepID=A0A1Z2SLC7_VIBGA|nr:hypothetical protein [Vibrio gazogenes]ASA57945.1 hypothetical protein BSQ33_19760 [Vibrio gazogenes]